MATVFSISPVAVATMSSAHSHTPAVKLSEEIGCDPVPADIGAGRFGRLYIFLFTVGLSGKGAREGGRNAGREGGREGGPHYKQ